MKKFMAICAPVTSHSGYGAHARDLVVSLIRSDKYDVRIMGINWGDTPMNALDSNNPSDRLILDRLMKKPELERQPDVNIQVTVPTEFEPIGKYNIGITAGIETTLASAQWVEACNRMDLIIVPSQHAKDTLVNSTYQQKNEHGAVISELKVVKPIEVLFEGLDTKIYKKTNDIPITIKSELDSIEDKWNFLFVGHWLKGELGQDRKDTGMLVKVFLETFKNQKNPPGLIMKTSSATFSIIDKYELIKKIKMIKNTIENAKTLPNIHIIHGDLTNEEMNGLYNHPKVKAHISFTKGEGFGRPLLEASVSEKIVIAPNWSGQTDFLNGKNSVLLQGKVAQVHPSAVWENVVLPNSGWFTVNYPYAAGVMKDVVKNYRNYKMRAVKQAMLSRGKFSMEKMDELFIKMMDKYLPTFAQPVELKLPTLKKKESNIPSIKLPKLKKLGETANV